MKSSLQVKTSRFGNLASAAMLSSIFSLAPAYADGIFRPSSFKVTFYEIGFRDSVTGNRTAIFQNSSGTQVDLSQPTTLSLITGVRPQNGTYDQGYALISNSIVLAGTDGNGCYIRAGATASSSNGTFAIVTNNAALRGEGTTTETSWNGSLGPVTPTVTSTVNGSAVSSLSNYLVSSTNPTPNGGGTINRFLFLGALAKPVIISDSNSGTVTYTVDTSRALEIGLGCGAVFYTGTKFNISVE